MGVAVPALGDLALTPDAIVVSGQAEHVNGGEAVAEVIEEGDQD